MQSPNRMNNNKGIVTRILYVHYLGIHINNEISTKILECYINELDEYHHFFADDL